MRFIAAIPNYNHGKSLVMLLDQLLDEDFDTVYVLDDASTDNSLELLEPYYDKIELIKGSKNLGPAGNRNRIIPYIQEDDILMSIDADMILESTNIRHRAIELFEKNKSIYLFGAGIHDSKDRAMTYNYWRQQSRFRHGVGLFLEYLAVVMHFKSLISLVRPLAYKFTYNVEIRFYEPIERAVDCVSEAHYYIKGDVFKQFGGYDERLRYHEGDEFAYRFRNSGNIIKFTPEFWSKHLKINSRAKLRWSEGKKLKKIIKNESK